MYEVTLFWEIQFNMFLNHMQYSDHERALYTHINQKLIIFIYLQNYFVKISLHSWRQIQIM